MSIKSLVVAVFSVGLMLCGYQSIVRADVITFVHLVLPTFHATYTGTTATNFIFTAGSAHSVNLRNLEPNADYIVTSTIQNGIRDALSGNGSQVIDFIYHTDALGNCDGAITSLASNPVVGTLSEGWWTRNVYATTAVEGYDTAEDFWEIYIHIVDGGLGGGGN